MSYFDIYYDIEQVLVLHGLFGSKSNWVTVARKLAKKYELIIPDMPNHGTSPIKTDDPISYEFLAHHMIAFIKKYLKPPVNIIGHSLGGKTAMLVALLEPELIKKLVIVDIAPKSYSYVINKIYNGFTEFGYNNISTKSRDELKQVFLGQGCGRDEVAFLLKGYKKIDENTYQWAFNSKSIYMGTSNITEFPHMDGKISAPTLILDGEDSHYINNVDDRKYFSKYLENYEIVTVPNAGHNVHFDNTEFFAQQVFRFI